MALLSYALTTLAGLKEQLEITGSDQDSLLEHLINSATERLEREMGGRRIAATDYVQWISPDGQFKLVLGQYPIIQFNAMGLSTINAMDVTYSGSGVYAQVVVDGSKVRLIEMSITGSTTTTDVDYATYETISEVATQITATSGWSATLRQNGPATHLRPHTESALNGNVVNVDKADQLDFPSAVDEDNGIVEVRDSLGSSAGYFGFGNPRATRNLGYGSRSVMVDYRAGYETIPADIDQITREFAASMYYTIGQDANVQSESLGSYSRTLASKTQLTDDMRVVLGRYTREILT